MPDGATTPIVGYGTNVHAGVTLDQVRSNLDAFAVPVREHLGADRMGVGLWLSADAAAQIRSTGAQAFRGWMSERGLFVFTINGFPQRDFHEPIVKHRVYEPNWTTDARQRYTEDLVEVAAGFAEEGGETSVSTLPLKWGTMSGADRDAAATRLRAVAATCAAALDRTGVLVHVDLEPEPGCALTLSSDVVTFYGSLLAGRAGAEEELIRRHIRVCHDVCHAAVMWEAQEDVFDIYASAGILVGKVQVSSALHIPFDALDAAGRAAAQEQLTPFGEERYLHQTTVRSASGPRMYEDLPDFLRDPMPTEPVRVHYHVPVFHPGTEVLHTTQSEIAPAIDAAQRAGVTHFEVETYAWDVLPDAWRDRDLAAGIARELSWVEGVMREVAP